MKLLTSPDIDRYAHEHTRAPSPLLDALREETLASLPSPQMQVGRVEGALLRLLVSLSGARSALEIGTFSGYSALCIAEGLPEGGRLVTCEIDPAAATVARRYFDASPHGAKIELALGDALETLRGLPPGETLDFAFIDADKARYLAYYEEIVPRLRPGGVVLGDNALWSGEVVSPQSDAAKALAAFNARVVEDPRVDNVLLTVRDGIMLARKR